MIPCMASACRKKVPEFTQIGQDPKLGRMGQRKLLLNRGKTAKGPWLIHEGGWPEGVYCAHCQVNLDYSKDDLENFGIDDSPFIIIPPEYFSANDVIKALKKKWGKRIAFVKNLDPLPERLADPAVELILQPGLREVLHEHVLPPGKQLYWHQGEALRAILRGEHVVIVTPTASGKSLCYQLPILNTLLKEPNATALYLSPLKALGIDQFEALLRYDPKESKALVQGREWEAFFREIHIAGKEISLGVYDGSTPDSDVSPFRRRIRKLRPNIILTNPDMLHTGILSNVRLWEDFFRHLRYVVIDELHIYRGIFGSNFANVMRRLRRLCHHLGTQPGFIACSATIRNPESLARSLIGNLPGDRITLIDQDGSPKHRREFVLMAGTEDAVTTDARKLLTELLAEQRISLIAFGGSIPAVNRVYRDTRDSLRKDKKIEEEILQPFMAPLPPETKREIARRLTKGELRGAVSTTALQLGIDIGNFSAAVLIGYPGSIAATWQQAGRAGRRGEGLYVLLADKDPVDQFWLQHPEVFFAEEPEEVIVDPDNKYVLFNQLWCAHKDLEIDEQRDAHFFGRNFLGCLEDLRQDGKVQKVLKGGRDVWVLTDENGFPAKEVPLRNPLGKDRIMVITAPGAAPVAYEDSYRATKRLHPHAIYQVIDQDYRVEKLVLDGPERYALVNRISGEVDYFTVAVSQDSSQVIETRQSRTAHELPLHHGDVNFTSEVVAYLKKYYESKPGRETEYHPLGKARPPRRSFDTKATWVEFPPSWTVGLEGQPLVNGLNSIGKAMVSATGILRFADPNDLGSVVEIPELPILFIHEQYPGGIGLAENSYYRFEELLQRAYQS